MNVSFSISKASKLVKIEIHVDLTLLSNFHLIYKGDLLMMKVLKLRSEFVDRV